MKKALIFHGFFSYLEDETTSDSEDKDTVFQKDDQSDSNVTRLAVSIL